MNILSSASFVGVEEYRMDLIVECEQEGEVFMFFYVENNEYFYMRVLVRVCMKCALHVVYARTC